MVTGGAFPSPMEAAGRGWGPASCGVSPGRTGPKSQILRHLGRRVWEEKQSIFFVVFEKSNVEKDIKRKQKLSDRLRNQGSW